MKSLRDLLRAKNSSNPLKTTQRLESYIEKKYNFAPEISLSPQRIITIYAPRTSLVSLLKLDWANLNQLVVDEYKIQIRLKKTK